MEAKYGTVHAAPLKQRQLLARKEADKVRERLQKLENDKQAAALKAKRDAELDAEAAKEEQMRDQLQIENEKKTKAYFVIDKYNRKVPPEREPSYFGEFARIRDSWVPHGEGAMLLDGDIHVEGSYVKGMLWGQGKYMESNGSVWEGGFYDGHMHGIGYYTENDFQKYPNDRLHADNSESSRSKTIAEDRGDRIDTNGGYFHTMGNRLEALMRRGELICYLKELEIGMQLELSDRSLGVPLRSRATIIEHVKGWKFRCRMQGELNPRERQIDLSTTKEFRVLRELTKAYDMSSFSSGRPDGSNLSMDQEISYNYITDTFQLPAIKSIPPPISTASSRIYMAPSSSTIYGLGSQSTITSMNSNVGTISRMGSKYGLVKKMSKDEVLDKEKAERAKIFLANAQGVGPNLGIAGSRPTAEMRLLNTTALLPEQRKKSDYKESVFEARAFGIGKTLDADFDEAERERKKAEWSAILNRRREEDKMEKQRMVDEQQALMVAEASMANAEKRKVREAEDVAAKASIEIERLGWEKKQAEEELKMKQRDQERAQAKLKSR